jgi:DNA-binding SARP family transcriptional activator
MPEQVSFQAAYAELCAETGDIEKSCNLIMRLFEKEKMPKSVYAKLLNELIATNRRADAEKVLSYAKTVFQSDQAKFKKLGAILS